ncbi:MAG: hypothetical protein ABWZ66_13435 [Pyrinomonadaceae bacterium]
MSKNRFSGLSAIKTLQSTVTSESKKKVAKNASIKQETISESDKRNEIPRRGRPNGKRSNENYRQVTAYVNKETYKRTKMKLLENDNNQEFSELIDDLLLKWLSEK